MKLLALLIILNGIAALTLAAINPKNQPRDVFSGHNTVLLARVAESNADARTITLDVQKIAKGDFAPKQMTLKGVDDKSLACVLGVEKGQDVVMFIGGATRGTKRNALYYIGGGKWHVARIAENPDAAWELVGDADEGKDTKSIEIMFATFNGSVARLWDAGQDMAAERHYFPPVPFGTFTAQPVAKLEKLIGGVAIIDVNRDGRLDLFACSSSGNRLFVQDDKGVFADHTAAAGLDATHSSSCSFADANGDGTMDLLLDGVLYLQADGRFKKTDAVPVQPAVHSAAFVDIDGDGYPDVVISRPKAGLSVFRNTSATKGAFEDITAKLKLNTPENGSNGTGYFEAGDWNNDGRADLVYLAGPGYLLLQKDGAFHPMLLGGEDEGDLFTTAAMTPLVDPAANMLSLVTAEAKVKLIQREADTLADVTRFGNEIQEDINGGMTIVAEDLTADGNIDLYMTSREKGSPGALAVNRGYGSFIWAGKYPAYKVVPQDVIGRPAAGIAAGDVNGDGANDLLIGGLDGSLTLLINHHLADRKTQAASGTKADESIQIQTRLLTVRIEGKSGVLGATMRLTDAKERLIASRQIGGNIGVGSSGPMQVIFAAREPGRHQLHVTFSDGAKASIPVDLSASSARHQTITVLRNQADLPK